MTPQVVNRPNQFLIAAARIEKIHLGGPHHFMQLDIRNAFNSVPHIVIWKGLEALCVSRQYIEYMLNIPVLSYTKDNDDHFKV